MLSSEPSTTAAPAIDLIFRVTHRAGRSLSYELLSPAKTAGFRRRTIPGPELHAPDAFRDDLFRKLDSLHRGIDGDGRAIPAKDALRDLESLGRELYHRLFPEALRDLYQGFRRRVKTLLVVSDDPWIPWELVKPYDDQAEDDFLCLQFQMSRWLPQAKPLVIERGVRRLACIEGGQAEAQATLVEVEEESRMLRKMGDGLFDVTVEEDATFAAVDALLCRGGWDGIHFAGHGDWAEAADESNVGLADQLFRVRHLSGPVEGVLARDRPLVFFNACRVARMDRALTGLGGWAERWVVRCGASVFLAPLWSVADERSLAFATAFYRELRAGRRLGEAVLAARQELRASQGEELTWLAYSLYGHPLARVKMGEDILAEVALPGSVLSVPDAQPVLKIPDFPWQPNRSSPGALLRADYRIVRFHFRQEEIDDLETWCRDEAPVGVRLYTGAGGMGKTRLALEICERMRSAGWQAGLVDKTRTPQEIWRTLEKDGRPRLILIDYAETNRDLLVPLLREAYRVDDGPVRILLLARAALDWWDQLRTEGDGVGELLRGPATSRHRLKALALTPEARDESYRLAAKAFSRLLGAPSPAESPDDLEAEHFDRALVLHMSALAAVEGVRVKGEEGIFDFVLDREGRFWRTFAQEREMARSLADGIGRAMALITLGGGADSQDRAVAAISMLAHFRGDQHRDLVAVAQLLRDIYPGERRWIDPVMPDLLGEHLIRREMEKSSDELLDILMKVPKSLE